MFITVYLTILFHLEGTPLILLLAVLMVMAIYLSAHHMALERNLRPDIC
jgi:hypothetical protein